MAKLARGTFGSAEVDAPSLLSSRLVGTVVVILLAMAGECVAPGAVRSEEMVPRHLLLIEAPVNRDDAFVGGTYRFLASRQLGFGPFVSFDGRSEKFTALQQIGPHLFIQRREARYLGALGLDGSLYLGANAGVFAAVAAGYTFGSYEGTRAEPEEGWTPVFRVGVLGRFRVTADTSPHLRVGYEYADLRSVASNRTYIAVGVEF
jgi:hypothetical protein